MTHSVRATVLLLVALSLLYAGGTNAQPDRQYWVERSATMNAARNHDSPWDCTQSHMLSQVRPPVQAHLFDLGRTTPLTLDQPRDVTAARFSPDGATIVFVIPTDDVRQLPPARSLRSRDEQPVAISRNELWLYTLHNQSWGLISPDGSSPTFSANGRLLYFISETDLVTFDLTTSQNSVSGRRTSTTAEGFLLSMPTRSGHLITTAPAGRLSSLHDTSGKLPALQLTAADRFTVSPDQRHVVVAYSGLYSETDNSPVAVLYQSDGATLPLMRNCPVTAIQFVWNQDSVTLAYPVNGEVATIHLVDTNTSERRIIPAASPLGRISGLSFSPDGRYLAYTQEDAHSGEPIVWVTNLSGTLAQPIGRGLMPTWSPVGSLILVAEPSDAEKLEWFTVELN